ncbi:uncharacterized protein LOC121560581 [Coregonus clupeaformis]|uniref:uncharacterized protein LOC121560581 n=1 Tax=Coregonus clupeaformis TaxID=59861 RepID=UPI001E1C9811|nr:uncharacterized protein LOC121560581 [Coregonus clupeaformis]
MENKEFKQAAVVTFTTVTHKDETSQTSLTLSRGKRSYPDLHTFVQGMKDDHWNLLSENMRAGMSRHEFSAKCMDIVAWVMESTSTVVVPALDLTMQIELSDSPSSSGSGSNEAGEVTSLGRSVRFSCSGGPSRCTSARTACSTRTPTPFPPLTAIKTELENQRPTNLAARDLLSSLVETIEDMDISDILQGPSAILEEAAVIKHPEMSTSTIYRSLLLDSSLASSKMVTESIIFNNPCPSEENWRSILSKLSNASLRSFRMQL